MVKKTEKKLNKKIKLSEEIKYQLYEASVQNPGADIDFLNKEFKKLRKRSPYLMREDFCGTALLSHEWVKQSSKHRAWGIDLDLAPLNYAQNYTTPKLTNAQKKRIDCIHGNVLSDYPFHTDIVVAFNFSYFIFKKRQELLGYFRSVRKSLAPDGVFAIDLFGGTEAFSPLIESKKFKSHIYYWDCEFFNPLTSECHYAIHFKYKGVKFKNVFTYDWRMWGVAELCEILIDAGFSKTVTYWEGDDGKGGGNGKFFPTNKALNCESWVTYIMALN